MWIVLCWRSDHSALWAFDRLRQRGRLQPLELVLLEDLCSPLVRWEQRLSGGSATVKIGLPDGRELDSGRVHGVLNRMISPPTAAAVIAHPEDQQYATAECTAFAASWLRAIGPVVVNEPRPNALVGPFLHVLQWRSLGRRAGLAIAPFAANSADGLVPPTYQPVTELLVVAGEVLGADAPGAVLAGARALFELTGVELLALRFIVKAGGTWLFVEASPYPDLTRGGEQGIDALEDVLAA